MSKKKIGHVLIEAYGGPAHGVMVVCDDDVSPHRVRYIVSHSASARQYRETTYLWQDIQFLWCVGECVPLDGIVWIYKALVWEETLKRESQYDVVHNAQLKFSRAHKASNFRG